MLRASGSPLYLLRLFLYRSANANANTNERDKGLLLLLERPNDDAQRDHPPESRRRQPRPGTPVLSLLGVDTGNQRPGSESGASDCFF